MTAVFDASALIGALERAEAPARLALVDALAAARAGAPGPYVSALTVAELLRGAASDDALAAVGPLGTPARLWPPSGDRPTICP